MRSAPILVLSLLLACNPTVDDTADPGTEALPDPASDTDGDGLSYQDETVGWTVSLNTTGYPQDTRTVLVTSDPNSADADGDGLTDDLERLYKCDPNRVDTDADGLDDRAEALRWGTNPAHADSDGDSRGSDPDFPAPPNRALFDGPELSLTEVGGRLTPRLGATSPLHADTDGDGIGDFDELSLTRRNPTLAELPQISVTPSPFSGLDFTLDIVYDSSSGSVQSYSASREWERTREFSKRSYFQTQVSSDISVRAEGSVKGTAGTSFVVEGEVDTRVTQHTEGSFDLGIDMNEEGSNSFREAAELINERTQRDSYSVVGGEVQMLVDVQNTGTRTYLVEGLGIVVYHWTGLDLQPVAYLEPTIPPFTLGPGEWASSVVLRDSSANGRRIQALMKDPRRAVLGITNLDLSDVTGDDFAYVHETVAERTSTVSIQLPATDERDERIVRMNIASHVDRTDDGALAGIAMADILDSADLEWTLTPTLNPVDGEMDDLLAVEDRSAAFHEGAIDETLWEGLDAQGYVYSDGPGLRALRANWFYIIDRYDRTRVEDPLLPALQTPVFPGDVAELVYALDRDRDGISDIEEWLHNASDEHIDSDADDGRSDGLSDYWEIREGWMVTVAGLPPYRAFSSPSSMDGDSDGVRDDAELLAGTDPMLADTDGDGFSDLGELNSVGLGYDPLTPNEPGALTLTCTNKPGEAGTYVVEVYSDLGQAVIGYDSGEPGCGEDEFCHLNRANIEGTGEALTSIINTPTHLVVEVLAPARINWRTTQPIVWVDVGTLAHLETACPRPE